MESKALTVERFTGETPGQRVLFCRGPLTFENLSPFNNALRMETAPITILDLSEVPYIDSAGLGAIVTAHVSCNKSGRQLVLSGPRKRVVKLFKITGVEPLFLIFPSLDGAIEALTTAGQA